VDVGPHTVTWDPGSFVVSKETDQVRVRAWSTNAPPDYMVLDLVDAAQPVHYYETADFLPDGDVTNDIHRTEKLVMRRVHAAGAEWRMGAPIAMHGNASIAARETPHFVLLTNDYYMSVFELTAKQAAFVNNSSEKPAETYSDADVKPYATSYNALRGTAQVDFLGWPQSGHAVSSNGVYETFLQKMRPKYGNRPFDLATEAQWEFACRAGTLTDLPNGKNVNNSGSANTEEIAWMAGNSGNAAHPVGLKPANAWGFYDMIGNNYEWVLDWYSSTALKSSESVVEPVGPSMSSEATPSRLYRGGCYSTDKTGCRSASKYYTAPNASTAMGVRLVLPCGCDDLAVYRYDLAQDRIVTCDVLVDGVSVGAETLRRLAGDVNKLVRAGTSRTIYLRMEGAGLASDKVQFKLSLWKTDDPPDFLVADATVSNAVESVRFYPTANVLPLGDLTNNAYRMEKVVMRRIPAEDVTAMIGRSDRTDRCKLREVSFSEDFYLQCFMMSAQAQLYLTAQNGHQDADGALEALKPATCSTQNLRGLSSAEWPGWPQKLHEVKTGTYLARMRATTGIELDLPTAAQWEYACRGGSANWFNNGGDTETDCGEVAWYKNNSQSAAHPVGVKKPNIWNLYDMHGLANELNLDWFVDWNTPSEAGRDPKGVDNAGRTLNARIIRSGTRTADYTSASAPFFSNGAENSAYGYRLVCPVSVWANLK